MRKTIAQWNLCNPEVMAHRQSRAAILHTIAAAKSDILELHAEVEKLREQLGTDAHVEAEQRRTA